MNKLQYRVQGLGKIYNLTETQPSTWDAPQSFLHVVLTSGAGLITQQIPTASRLALLNNSGESSCCMEVSQVVPDNQLAWEGCSGEIRRPTDANRHKITPQPSAKASSTFAGGYSLLPSSANRHKKERTL